MIKIIKKITIDSRGMECYSCEQRIEAALRKLDGIKTVKSDYQTEVTVVEYDENKIDEQKIKRTIETLGYVTEQKKTASDRFGTFAIALGIFAILAGTYLFIGDKISLDFSNINMEAGFAALFGLGLLTGFHCVGMCGGFVLSYSKNIKSVGDFFPHLLYGSGKTASYAIIGGLFGALGSFIAFTIELRASVAIIAGLFLVIYGLNMLNVLPFLRKVQLRLPSIIPLGERKKNHGPLVTGLLNGLMIACGPLQALYIFAAGTGSAIIGAYSMFFFGLGTLVPLITFGIASNFMSRALSSNIVRFSGVLVIVMGLAMASNGLNLLGANPISINSVDEPSDTTVQVDVDDQGYQIIKMNVTRYGWEPSSFVLKKGVPVKWEINGLEINGCNNEIIVRDYDINVKIKQGVQTVEFLPEKEGVIKWSCWMGMIPGQFIVSNDVELEQGEATNTESLITETPQLPQGSGCGGNCGSSSCGARTGGGCGCGG